MLKDQEDVRNIERRIGMQFRLAREFNELTREQVAAAIGCDEQDVLAVEAGQFDKGLASGLVQLFDLNPLAISLVIQE